MLADKVSASADKMATVALQTGRKCEGGDTERCEMLGKLYLNGRGVPKDEEKALSVFEKACAQGNMRSCLDTGALYATATGAPADMPRAKQFMDKACAGGDQIACDNAQAIAPYLP